MWNFPSKRGQKFILFFLFWFSPLYPAVLRKHHTFKLYEIPGIIAPVGNGEDFHRISAVKILDYYNT